MISQRTGSRKDLARNKEVALVTGAATGIGRPAAGALGEAGFSMVINYAKNESAARTTAEQVRAKGAKTLPFKCGVRALAAGSTRSAMGSPLS